MTQPEDTHTPTLDHPTFSIIKEAFTGRKLRGTEFRNQAALVVEPGDLHEVMLFLRDASNCAYDFLSDVVGIDYLNYPAPQPGRFAVAYVLESTTRTDQLIVKTFVEPTLPTQGTEADPGLSVPSVCDIWPGAEWPEREVYDMFGIRFEGHPDLRRILTWEDFPAHPLRKDYPLRGRGEREHYHIVDRTDV